MSLFRRYLIPVSVTWWSKSSSIKKYRNKMAFLYLLFPLNIAGRPVFRLSKPRVQWHRKGNAPACLRGLQRLYLCLRADRCRQVLHNDGQTGGEPGRHHPAGECGPRSLFLASAMVLFHLTNIYSGPGRFRSQRERHWAFLWGLGVPQRRSICPVPPPRHFRRAEGSGNMFLLTLSCCLIFFFGQSYTCFLFNNTIVYSL